MKVAFEFIVPVFDSFDKKRSWQKATVISSDLNITPEQIYELVQKVISFNPRGSVSEILRLTRFLELMAPKLPVWIAWNGTNITEIESDTLIHINYESGKVCTNGRGFLFHAISNRYDDGRDWMAEFVTSLCHGD